MTILYINDEHCFNINQLKQYFELPIKYGSTLFNDILDYGRAGDIAAWLREHKEYELADNVEFIDNSIGDGEYMSRISDIITGNKVSSSKPDFSKLFVLEDIKVNELENETIVCVYLKNKRIINEAYELMIRSSWGTRAVCINPLDYKQGMIIKQEFCFRNRPTPMTKIELYADGVKLKSARGAQSFQVGDYEFKMILVEHGTFKRDDNSELLISEDYLIGETQVTQEFWKKVMDYNPSHFKGDNLPVENVSWQSCQWFINKLNNITHKKFRLPTKDEWEFAAHGGNMSAHTQYSGSNEIDEVAWYRDNSDSTPHPVATKYPNELGIYDMTGNVWEWLIDKDSRFENMKNSIGGSWCDDLENGFRFSLTYSRSCNMNLVSRTQGFRLCLSE